MSNRKNLSFRQLWGWQNHATGPQYKTREVGRAKAHPLPRSTISSYGGRNIMSKLVPIVSPKVELDERRALILPPRRKYNRLNNHILAAIRDRWDHPLKSHITFTIQTTKYLYNMASSLEGIIEEMGFAVYKMSSESIASEIKNNEERSNNIYIFLCVGHIFDIPKRSSYYIYNLEQVNYYDDFQKLDLDGKRGEFVIKAFKNSRYIFDYSEMNISNYPEDLKKKAIYLPIPLFDNKKSKTGVDANKKECDILFFGGMSERRQKILEYLRKNTDFNIKVVTDVFGSDIIDLIKKTRVIINIHYRELSLLEIARIHDCIRFHKSLIVSEESIDRDIMEQYKHIVEYVPVIKADLSNINEFVKRIQDVLENGDISYLRWKSEGKIRDMIRKQFSFFQIYKYPYLFHKYLLGLSIPNKSIIYKVIQKNTDSSLNSAKLFAHLHCYDISKFDEIYGEYIKIIDRYFTVVVTYSIGEYTLSDRRFHVLKIPNKGMDIGAKFCMVQYLKDQQIDYSYILFLHSKSNPDARRKYFAPLLSHFKEEETANEFIENINDYDGYFPDIQWEIQGDRLNMISGNLQFANSNLPERNLEYRRNLLDYLGCENRTNRFIEGNVYLLSKKVVERLFGDKRLYNILNRPQDFDYNWVCKRYGLRGDFGEAYNQFVTRKLSPRDDFSYDGYIEHAFEKVVLNVCGNLRICRRLGEQQINILIRNTYRPSYFPKCINSILNQTNQNFRIIMCYDDENCLEYLEKYKNNPKIEIFKATEVDRTGQAFYNLYCNQLLDRVKKGWIMFLDDDDLLIDKNSLQDIANNLDNKDNMLFWKVKIAKHIIYPKNINIIEINKISGIGFCFHSTYKNLARWDPRRGGDYRFITKLLENKKDFKRKFVDKILTGIQHTDKMGLLGQKEAYYKIIENIDTLYIGCHTSIETNSGYTERSRCITKYLSNCALVLNPLLDFNVKFLNNSIHFLDNIPILLWTKEAITKCLETYNIKNIVCPSNAVNFLSILYYFEPIIKKKKITTIYEVRGLWYKSRNAKLLYEYNNISQKMKNDNIRLQNLELQALTKCDKMCFITDQVKDYLLKLQPALKIKPNIIIYNSADNVLGNIKTRKKDKNKIFTIGYTGSITAYEGIQDLIEVCKTIYNKKYKVELRIIGKNTLNMDFNQPFSNFSPWMKQKMLNEEQKSFDLYCIPRRGYEVCNLVSPIKPYDAFSKKIPLLMSDCNCLRDIAGNGSRCRLFKQDNLLDLESKIIDIITNGYSDDLLENAYNFVKEERNWKYQVDRYNKFLS